MDTAAFFELLFEPLTFLGPGTEADTRRLLDGLGLVPEHRLLELGAGQGRSAILAARERGCRVLATDASAVFVDRIRGRAAQAGLAGRIEARVADLREPAPLGTFPALLCEGAAYVAGFAAFLGAARAVLRPPGRLALSYPIRTEAPGGAGVVALWNAQLTEPLHTLEELSRIVREQGYGVSDAWSYGEVPWRTYLEPVAARLPDLVPRVPPDSPAGAELASFRDEIRIQLDEGGWRFFTYGALVLERR